MNFVDLAFLTMSALQGGRMIYKRKKSGTVYSIAITSEMKEILSHYTQFKKSSDRIFPIMDGSEGMDKKKLHALYSQRWKDHIKYLNRLAKMAGIESRVTTYTIRHSWASGMRDAGADIYSIKEGMGHSDTGTTEIYLSEIENKVVDDWNEKFLNG